MSVDSNTEPGPGTATDPASAMAAFWLQWLEQSSRGTQALLEAVQSISDPAKLQQAWLDALAQSLESFMRTPAFMDMMRRNLKTITDLKTTQDQVIHGTARHLGAPLADDITGLFERLYSTEQTILNRLEAIENRLDALASRADAGRGDGESAPGPHA